MISALSQGPSPPAYQSNATFGVAPDATEGFDEAYDTVAPPDPPTGINSYFILPSAPTQPLYRSIIASGNTTYAWYYVVKAISDGQVHIILDEAGLATLPFGYTVTLYGKKGTPLVDMTATQPPQYSYQATAGQVRTFGIIVTVPQP